MFLTVELKRIPLPIVVLVSLMACPCANAGNLVANEGFEDGLAGWEVRVRGEWARRVDHTRLVHLTDDARTGKTAVCVDTRLLNPSGQITDEFRIPKKLKYEITFSQKVGGIEPGSWYLAEFHVKSTGIAVDEGLEYLADLQPWPLKTFGSKRSIRPLWRMIHAWEKRLFLPQAPITDGDYHEYVLLKETYATTDTIEIGLRIRAPWTGRILIDDVSLAKTEPDREMSSMEKFLAMRATKPFTEVRRLNRETTLVNAGSSSSAILIPEADPYSSLGARIQTTIEQLTGVAPLVVSQLDQVPPGTAIVAVGSMMQNELVARLHFNRYVRADALSPGPGGYVVWTVAEPYGLEPGQNVIVVAGSDAPGEANAVDRFCDLLKEHETKKSITLPYLHEVAPNKTISPDEHQVPRDRWGFNWDRERFAGFANWYLPRWLATGDLKAARLAREEILKVADAYLEGPYFQVAWDSYEVGWAWDTLEETPVFSDEDRLKITNLLLGYMHMRPQAGTSGWSAMEPRLMSDEPTWNHQAKGLAGAYAMARYFQRFYPDQDGRYDYYLAAAGNAFGQQAKYSKPQENSANYWLITMRFALSYYLGEWDMTFFENDAMRRYAEYFAVVTDNRGGLAGFGDAYYCYAGWRAGAGFNDWQVPLAFWRYRDGRLLWWLEQLKPDYQNPYHLDVEPVPWQELLGVRKVPLEPGLYVPDGAVPFWSAEGQGAVTAGEVPFANAFDKVSFRDNWKPDGEYMLLEGLGRGIHSGKGTNQICKLSLLGEDLLIGSTYKKNNPRTNCSVVVVKDAAVEDTTIKGPGRFPFQWWAPLGKQTRGYAALNALADLPHTGFTRTSIPDHLGGTDWHRNVFWVKGHYFAMIDEIVARQQGTYHVECNYSTCPQPRRGSFPPLTPRTWRMREGNRVFEINYQTADAMKQYIVSDRTASFVIDPFVYEPDYLTKVIVRQQHERRELAAGEKVSFLSLFFADRAEERLDYRLERIGDTEGMLFRGQRPVAYFGCGQTERSRALLPIEAEMFLLTDARLAVVDATSAGPWLTTDTATSVELAVPKAHELLNQLGAFVDFADTAVLNGK